MLKIRTASAPDAVLGTGSLGMSPTWPGNLLALQHRRKKFTGFVRCRRPLNATGEIQTRAQASTRKIKPSPKFQDLIDRTAFPELHPGLAPVWARF